METRIRQATEAVLRLPLLLKLVVANTAILLAAVGFTAWVLRGAWDPATIQGPGASGSTPVLVVGIVLAAVLLGALVDTVLVRLALSPLRRLEEVARQVGEGREGARVGASTIADRELAGLMARFDSMLDALDDARARRSTAAFRLVRSEEGLRMRLARELYEDLGQRLAAVLLVVGGAIRADAPDRDHAGDSRKALIRIQKEVAEVLEGMRRTARRLHPPELEELGIMEAIQAEARTVWGRSGVPVTVRPGPPGLSLEKPVGLVLFRLVQECLDLLLDQIGPEGVRVAIEVDGGELTCEIEATGCTSSGLARLRARDPIPSDAPRGNGHPPARAPRPEGNPSLALILESLRERAGWIGASVRVLERDGDGVTVIRIRVPGAGAPESPFENTHPGAHRESLRASA